MCIKRLPSRILCSAPQHGTAEYVLLETLKRVWRVGVRGADNEP